MNPSDATTRGSVFSEPAIFIPVMAITALGMAMVYSASATLSLAAYGTPLHYVQRQAVFFAMGMVAMVTAAWFPHRYLRPLGYLMLLVSLAAMAAVLTPLGVSAGGARRWLTLGGITFQPSEFARFALLVYLAGSLSRKEQMIQQFFIGFFPHALMVCLFATTLMLQKDLGGIVIIGVLSWLMMFIAGVRVTHLLSVLPLLIPFAYFFIYRIGYRMERILSFLNPWLDPLDSGFQLTHSLKAFGSGGIFGKGIGLGMQKQYYLPEPHTDFIFSVIGEELGLLGVLTILCLYAIILKRGATIARNSDTRFGTFLAAGICIHLALQVIINIGVTLGVLPTKGLTLPFISYGGTSLLVTMTAMGVLMNIGRAGGPAPAKKPATTRKRFPIGQTH